MVKLIDFLHDTDHGVLPLSKRWKGFNFEKLKSFGGRIFFRHIGGKSIWRGSGIGNQRWGEGGHNSHQNNYHTITFFSRKSNFYAHFQRKNSFHFFLVSFKRTYVNFSLANIKRVASPHENNFKRVASSILVGSFYFYVTFYYDFLITHL